MEDELNRNTHIVEIPWGCYRKQRYFPSHQPQYELAKIPLRGFEALTEFAVINRFIEPCEFIPIAEESGLIIELSAWLIKEGSFNKRLINGDSTKICLG